MTTPMSRRRALAAGGTVGLGALIAACSSDGAAAPTTTATVPTTGGGSATVQPQASTSGATADLFPDGASCTLTPQETEGPYYFDVDAIRSDIRENREGSPLRLAMRAQDEACEPIANAVVDIWHCDAGGLYSGFESASRGGGGGGGRTDEETYLRGAQVTNAEGIVEFQTIYPGWYRGRTVHIHFKVHINKTTVLTGQLFFDEAVTEKVYAKRPYSDHTGRSDFNDTDSIFEESLLLTLRKEGDGHLGIMSVGVRSA